MFTKSKNQKKLQEMVEKIPLTDNQKKLWEFFVEKTSEDVINSVIELAEKDQKYMLFFTENLEKKSNAIKASDKNALKSILREEVKFIENE